MSNLIDIPAREASAIIADIPDDYLSEAQCRVSKTIPGAHVPTLPPEVPSRSIRRQDVLRKMSPGAEPKASAIQDGINHPLIISLIVRERSALTRARSPGTRLPTWARRLNTGCQVVRSYRPSNSGWDREHPYVQSCQKRRSARNYSR